MQKYFKLLNLLKVKYKRTDYNSNYLQAGDHIIISMKILGQVGKVVEMSGICLGIKKQSNTTFITLRGSSNTGDFYTVKLNLNSPLIKTIKVTKRSNVRTNKLYFIARQQVVKYLKTKGLA